LQVETWGFGGTSAHHVIVPQQFIGGQNGQVTSCTSHN
jgi:hypothetical protein